MANTAATSAPHRAQPNAPAGGVLTQLLAKTRPSMHASGRPLIMGVLNVTPDSFSDGGQFIEPAIAIEHARRLVAEGADLIDIGGESTRPYGGMRPVLRPTKSARGSSRILPAAATIGVPVSIDTMKASVAAWALEAGASIVNDVWGLQRDPDMARVVAEHGAPIIIMHNRESADPAIDIINDVSEFFSRSLEIAWSAGIAHDRIVLDPGIGFGKTPEQIAGLHRAARRMARLRRATSRRRLAQALHRFDRAVRADGAARRLAGRASPGGRKRRRHHSRP